MKLPDASQASTTWFLHLMLPVWGHTSKVPPPPLRLAKCFARSPCHHVTSCPSTCNIMPFHYMYWPLHVLTLIQKIYEAIFFSIAVWLAAMAPVSSESPLDKPTVVTNLNCYDSFWNSWLILSWFHWIWGELKGCQEIPDRVAGGPSDFMAQQRPKQNPDHPRFPGPYRFSLSLIFLKLFKLPIMWSSNIRNLWSGQKSFYVGQQWSGISGGCPCLRPIFISAYI